MRKLLLLIVIAALAAWRIWPVPQARMPTGEALPISVSRDYAMTYASGSFANLTDGEAVTVAGVAYRVRGEPHQLGDGALTRAALART